MSQQHGSVPDVAGGVDGMGHGAPVGRTGLWRGAKLLLIVLALMWSGVVPGPYRTVTCAHGIWQSAIETLYGVVPRVVDLGPIDHDVVDTYYPADGSGYRYDELATAGDGAPWLDGALGKAWRSNPEGVPQVEYLAGKFWSTFWLPELGWGLGYFAPDRWRYSGSSDMRVETEPLDPATPVQDGIVYADTWTPDAVLDFGPAWDNWIALLLALWVSASLYVEVGGERDWWGQESGVGAIGYAVDGASGARQLNGWLSDSIARWDASTRLQRCAVVVACGSDLVEVVVQMTVLAIERRLRGLKW